ncbi:MAG: 3'(2'),5'-bisphosphate nucleotidase [Ardenticatenales bacterium]|nr:3'(2'),5'-bisphosphate nucleotidase [Ardenticatenales bacterium]
MDTPEFETGLTAVMAAARLTEAVRAAMVAGDGEAALSKDDRSPVTIADFGAQALVCRAIRQRFPDDQIVAEEDSAALREPTNGEALAAVVHFAAAQLGTGDAVDENAVCRWIDEGNGRPDGRYWVLDPIDGTKGYLRNDQYAIALALIEDGAVQWAFLGCPALPHDGQSGVVFVAKRGAGSDIYTLDGQWFGPAQVSDIATPRDARMTESVESGHTNRGISGQLKARLGISESVRMDSQAKYAAVARGQAEIYLRAPNPKTPDYRENIWDHAAGWLVVSEAGGRVSDIHGQPLDWSHGRRLEENRGVVATNGHVHDEVIATIAEILAAAR